MFGDTCMTCEPTANLLFQITTVETVFRNWNKIIFPWVDPEYWLHRCIKDFGNYTRYSCEELAILSLYDFLYLRSNTAAVSF